MRVLFVLWLFVSSLLHAENPQAAAPASQGKLESLEKIASPLEHSREELKQLRSSLEEAATAEARRDIQTRIDSREEHIRSLRQNFRDAVGGAEAADYEGSDAPENTDLRQQVSELLQPMLGELREATSAPRELDALRKTLKQWQERRQSADTIVKRIDRISELNNDPAVQRELDSTRQLWTGRKAEATSRIGVLEERIHEREKQKRPFFEALSEVARRFFRSSGLNLLLALLAGALGFFITRRAYAYFQRVSPIHRKGKASLLSRSSDILAMAAAVFVCIAAIILVFYVSGDWFLLTLSIILIVGAAWAGKTALPPYLEQIRMMLNIGSVREGERLIYRDLPWKVETIAFQTILVNPSLNGGHLRIPIRELIGMISRESDPKEPWFPTQQDDWVILSDETFGKVITQTPEQIIVLRLGGSLKTFRVSEFLEMTPENLSRGFRVNCTFGIDYSHQPDATGSIPETLTKTLTAALIHQFGREAIHSVKVEITAAAASSIDYAIIADFDGSVASRYNAIHRRIQTLCIEACNDNEWIIPFTQITVHQAELDGDKAANPATHG